MLVAIAPTRTPFGVFATIALPGWTRRAPGIRRRGRAQCAAEVAAHVPSRRRPARQRRDCDGSFDVSPALVAGIQLAAGSRVRLGIAGTRPWMTNRPQRRRQHAGKGTRRHHHVRTAKPSSRFDVADELGAGPPGLRDANAAGPSYCRGPSCAARCEGRDQSFTNCCCASRNPRASRAC
jgi:hypothetical protein